MATENNYLKGYNAAFRLCQYNPEIIDIIKDKLDVSIDYQRGIQEGILEYERTKEQGREDELDEFQTDGEQDQNYER